MSSNFTIVHTTDKPVLIWLDPQARTVGLTSIVPHSACLILAKLEIYNWNWSWIRKVIYARLGEWDLLLELVSQFYAGFAIWEDDIGMEYDVVLVHTTSIWHSVNKNGVTLQSVVDKLRLEIRTALEGLVTFADGYAIGQNLFRNNFALK